MKLYHDIPKSTGVENALKRARQMLEFRWTPVERFTTGVSSAEPAGSPKIRRDIYFPSWRPQTGLPYSSVRHNEKYIGFNVSFETFVTALQNPKSVLYTRTHRGDEVRNMFSYYGVVCSCFDSYVCGFPYRTSGVGMTQDPEVAEVDTTLLENLELCDMVINPGAHVAVVTDIQRDEQGKVHFITVSESVLPLCVSKEYTVEEFRKGWLDKGYRVFRYAGVHRQTYEPSPYVPLEGDPSLPLPTFNTAFMSIFGDKANTRLDEAVEFTVFEPDWEQVEIADENGAVAVLPIADAAATFTPQKAGFYTAVCHKAGETSLPVHFCVTDSTVRLERETVAPGDTVKITFRNSAPEKPLLYIINRCHLSTERQRGYFTEKEQKEGAAEITIDLAPGEYNIYTVSRNAYGFYASERYLFRVEENGSEN